ncbi:MAG: zinc-ribbon domain-containing protein [Tissierellia bacterium]|nr:zinc-ribbon domain-containing protein [Tissierellia bacterium]
MKQIKPGRGPSKMGLAGSVIAIVFGVFWTMMAFEMTSNHGMGGFRSMSIFPIFGVVFIIVGIVQAIYHYKNSYGKDEDRYSIIDIVEVKEDEKQETVNTSKTVDKDYIYCYECGAKIGREYKFCPECGKDLR